MKKSIKKWGIIFLVPIMFISFMAIWSWNIESNRKLSKEYANKLVCYPDGDYNSNIIDGMKNRLSSVPEKYLKVLYDKQVFIRTINGKITSDPEISTDPNKDTLDKYTGVFAGDSIIISVDKTYTYSVEIHEVGHAVDNILFNDISDSNEFKDIFNREGPNFFNKVGQEHNLENSKEYFAETFNYYYCNYDTRKYLKERAPQTYKFIKGLEKRRF
ncbi:hypothetical protein HMPREF1982_01265 [Clostridiales bacterium oral taxon 876 str. F0540]|nr:hypothetical protein HMPREF1982_01265 [Clostridiales bacterium oral taxon 876 str. F0540]